jgi:hypothetical protein
MNGQSAYALGLVHNHSSGDASPSEADMSLTRRLAEGARILQLLRALSGMEPPSPTEIPAIAECNQNASKRVWEKLRTRANLTSRYYPGSFLLLMGRFWHFRNARMQDQKFPLGAQRTGGQP